MRNWYALYLRSRFEKKVFKDLEEKNVESFLPLIEEVHVWSDRKRKVQEPLFRGYVFVKTDLLDRYTILEINGVVRFVGIKEKPSLIPEEQIEWLRRVIDKPEHVKREQYLDVGERVQVIAGPLKGVEGIIKQFRGETRVVISLASIVQSVSVQVNADLLERVKTKEPLESTNRTSDQLTIQPLDQIPSDDSARRTNT
jgi:transcription antitermination factor NusG